MKCWICGDEAGTGEHLVKASDLRNYFGPVSQKTPLFFHTSRRRNVRLGSVKADLLKSKALICNRCNSSLTQPYDRAWDRFSDYLRRHFMPLPNLGYVDLGRIFPHHTRCAAIYLQLYFVKLFGCRIIEEDIPIDIRPFANALLNAKTLESVTLGFAFLRDDTGKRSAGVTHIEGINVRGSTVCATWLYSVGELSVFVEYSTLPKKSKSVRWWRPTRHGRTVPLTNTTRWGM
ncbi:HNH endonuclease 5 domain-containing protein [Burkholderia ubonensis]|nr:hypothetical protein BUB20358_03096 [Burkholderia ubonensis]